jgi:hypothetical protein
MQHVMHGQHTMASTAPSTLAINMNGAHTQHRNASTA